MIREFRWGGVAVVAFALIPVPAKAQRASDNAVMNADDAFGISVGNESSGIYSDSDTRGFSPIKAGNGRIDGIYYDPVGQFSPRIKKYTVIRVGFATESYPFAAPTGIADNRFHSLPTDLGATISHTFGAYGGSINDTDVRVPLVPGRAGFVAGIADADTRYADRSGMRSWGFGGRFFLRLGRIEIAPHMSHGFFSAQTGHVPIIVRGTSLPDQPKPRSRMLQPWATNRSDSKHYGVTVKGAISTNLSLRAGLFRSQGTRKENYAEIFTVLDAESNANHRLIADPVQHTGSTSGEALISLRLGNERMTHRIFAGVRGRNRLAEAGGSDVRDYGTIRLGEFREEPQPVFSFTTPNAGRIRQSSLMLGYLGTITGLGGINLGLQKARYRASARNGKTGIVTQSRDNPWLYNASIFVDLTRGLSFYAGHERGLEDNGLAPDNAVNRAEQLPATRTAQYEGGLRWKSRHLQMVINGFQITKPYFAADPDGIFTQTGQVRHRGTEISLSGQLGKRLHIVGGAVLMQPRLLGAARLQGSRPAGTPSIYARIDANYTTAIFGGLTPTISLIHTGRRAVGPKPAGAAGQLMLKGMTTVDLGLRQNFHVGKTAASFRATVQNAFDRAGWKVSAPGILNIDERRRFSLVLTADL